MHYNYITTKKQCQDTKQILIKAKPRNFATCFVNYNKYTPFLLRLVSPPRNSLNTSPNALRKEWNWSHWDIAILCKSVVFASGTPSRHPHLLSCSHYATSHFGAFATSSQNARTICISGRSRDSALRSRFRLRMSELVDHSKPTTIIIKLRDLDEEREKARL